jgi:hypothetical protein
MSEDFQDRRLLLTLIGIFLVAAGIVIGFFGPLEMYCFYLFSEGGPFHYEGFGFGSFMFGNIAAQIIGYYLIGIVGVCLGYGHLAMRRWARKLTLTLLWFWVIFGIPLTIVFLFVLFASKDPSIVGGLIALVLAGLAYFAAPWLLIQFYRSRDTRLTFEAHDAKPSWIDNLPQPVLVLSALLLFYVVVLHIPIFFSGLFPFFGLLLVDLEGIFGDCDPCAVRPDRYPLADALSPHRDGGPTESALSRIPPGANGRGAAPRHPGAVDCLQTPFHANLQSIALYPRRCLLASLSSREALLPQKRETGLDSFPGAAWLAIARHPHHERSLRTPGRAAHGGQLKVRLGSMQATDSLKANVAEQVLCCPKLQTHPKTSNSQYDRFVTRKSRSVL